MTCRSPTMSGPFHLTWSHLTHWHQSQHTQYRHVALLSKWENELFCKGIQIHPCGGRFMAPISVYETPGSPLVLPSKNQQDFLKTHQCLWVRVCISKCWHFETDLRAWFNSSLYVWMCMSVCMHVSIIQLSVYRAKRNVGRFPYQRKKKWMLVFPETAVSLDPLKLERGWGWHQREA